MLKHITWRCPGVTAVRVCRAGRRQVTIQASNSALITGANTGAVCPNCHFTECFAHSASRFGRLAGIGYETALSLASQGYATVLACRDMDKARAARDRIKCVETLPALA